MIALLQGTILSVFEDAILLFVQGVGYRVYVTSRFIESARTQTEVVVYTHHHIREDASELFGFADPEEYQLFTQLLKVSGVGPKMALTALSSYTPAMIRDGIVHQDVALLTSISGIGKKTAERIVLELKDSTEFLKGVIAQTAPQTAVHDDAVSGKSSGADSGASGQSGSKTPVLESSPGPTAAQALIALGYSHAEVAHALASIDREANPTIEEQVRQALKSLSQPS